MTPWRKYKTHMYRAKRTGIEFLLSFEEWMKIWEDSGHFHERGCHKGQYVMARYGDKGPYVVGNVKIIRHEENGSERVFSFNEEQKDYLSKIAVGRVHSEETKEKIAQSSKGRKHTKESKEKISKGNKGKNSGKKRSLETRLKMSKAKIGNTIRQDYLDGKYT